MPPVKAPSPPPSERYQQRRSRFGRCLTVYGRKTVLEALQADGVVCERLHLARSNKPAPLLEEIEALARAQSANASLEDAMRKPLEGPETMITVPVLEAVR